MVRDTRDTTAIQGVVHLGPGIAKRCTTFRGKSLLRGWLIPPPAFPQMVIAVVFRLG